MRGDTSLVYEDITKFAELKKLMEDQLEDYNMEPGVISMGLVLFRDAIEHGECALRISRVLGGYYSVYIQYICVHTLALLTHWVVCSVWSYLQTFSLSLSLSLLSCVQYVESFASSASHEATCY